MIDLAKVDYRLTLLPPSGSKIDVTGLIESCDHEEMDGEAAARISVKLKNIRRHDGWIHQHVYLAKRMVLEATDGNGWKEIFRGSTFRWKTIADNHTVEFVAYDPLYPIMHSEEHYYFTNGMTAAASIKQIANEWGIPIGRIDGPNVALTKKMYNGKIGDTIAKRIEESKEKGDGDYILRMTKGKLELVKKGTNATVYELTDHTTVTSSDERSIENMVTRVKIYGNENENSRPEIVAVENGKTEFGILQNILYKSNFSNTQEARAAAKQILKDKGSPEINRPLVHPDIPWLRKGDKVAVASGTIGGAVVNGKQQTVNCIVKSISRDLTTKLMTLVLEG